MVRFVGQWGEGVEGVLGDGSGVVTYTITSLLILLSSPFSTSE